MSAPNRPTVTPQQGDKTTLLICGVLILAAFPLYGGGQALMSSGQTRLGFALSMGNSVGVILIGILFYRIIARHSKSVARTYLFARLIEGSVLAAGVLIWLNLGGTPEGQQINTQFYRIAMTALALGSLPFCCWMAKTRFVPPLVGWGGIIGYLALAVAMVAQQWGANAGSMWLLMPGAIFEIVFAVTLVVRWFRTG